MDNVKITLQNKELIESIINGSKDVEYAVHQAIIDGVSKRVLKTILNNEELDKKIREAANKAQDEIADKYFNKKTGNWRYSTYFELKKEYQSAINKVFEERLEDEIKKCADNVYKQFNERYNALINGWKEKLDAIDINEIAKAAVAEAVEKRFGNK